jgi:hypothetical protein
LPQAIGGIRLLGPPPYQNILDDGVVQDIADHRIGSVPDAKHTFLGTPFQAGCGEPANST